MICISFYNPADVSLLLNKEQYNVVVCEDKIENINIDNKKDNIALVLGITNVIEHRTKFKNFKVLVFDKPHNFLKFECRIADAKNFTGGVCQFKPIKETIDKLIERTKKGVNVKGVDL